MSMNRFLIRALKQEKKSRLGPLEKFTLGRHGRKDGLHGLPREDEEGRWTSSFIQRERNACSESHNRIYGTLKIKLGEKYKTALDLADRLERFEARIIALERSMPKPLTEEESKIRKQGEETLALSQIKSRRWKEYERRKEKYQVQIDQIMKEAEADYEKLTELENELIQKKQEAELVCARIRNHTQQRIDYYWNAASYVSYENGRNIPAVFTQLQIFDVVRSYKEQHEEEEGRIKEVIQRYQIKKEAA